MLKDTIYMAGHLTTPRSNIYDRSDEGLRLETSAFESLYGGQFTLSTQLIEPNYHLTTCSGVDLHSLLTSASAA